jgi:hypothetical protein
MVSRTNRRVSGGRLFIGACRITVIFPGGAVKGESSRDLNIQRDIDV